MAHVHTDEHAAVTPSVLLRRVSQVLPGEWPSEEFAKLCGNVSSFVMISIYQGIIVESDAVDD